MMFRMSIGAASALGALGVAAFVPSALAQAPGFDMGLTVGDFSINYDWTQYGDLNGYGDWDVPGVAALSPGWNYTGVFSAPASGAETAGLWTISWNTVFDVHDGVAGGGGAFVTANIVVTNNDIVNQNFSLLMTLDTGPLAGVLERGSVIGTVTDLTNDDATVFAPAGGQIYAAMIDGVTEADGLLLVDPFSASAGGPFQSGTVGPASFMADSHAVESSIGIMLDFDLTPGDSASFTAIFEVIVPAPAGLPFLAALGLVAGRRRRRQS